MAVDHREIFHSVTKRFDSIIAVKYFIPNCLHETIGSTLRETDHRVVNYQNRPICFSDDRN